MTETTAPDGTRWATCPECEAPTLHQHYRPSLDGDVEPAATCHNQACDFHY